MITSQHDFRKTEHYFGLKNSFSDDYTTIKYNYIDEFSIYNGENGKWSLYITYRRNNVTSSRRREYINNMTSW